MARCVTCGSELHPERAEKYDYCTDPKCRERSAKSLTIVALGVNKAADHYQVLNERTQEKVATGEYVEEMASGRQRQRPRPRARSDGGRPHREAARGRPRPRGGRAAAAPAKPGPKPKRPWTESQQELALLYSDGGLRPDEIAGKLGLSTYTVTQMILEGRRRAKP